MNGALGYLSIRGLRRTYRTVEDGRLTSEHTLFTDLDLDLRRGEFVAVVGPSGCGKSTFLNLVGGLDSTERREYAPSRNASERIATVEGTGSVSIGGFVVSAARGNAKADFMNANIGFIFQFHHLIPELTALENVMLPALIQNRSWSEARGRASEMLQRVRLGGHASKRPSVLSGGERQRVAIARALVNKPGLVLADEPTGNLDPTLKGTTFDLLEELNRALEITVVMVTHDRSLLYDGSGQLRVSRLIDLAQTGLETTAREGQPGRELA